MNILIIGLGSIGQRHLRNLKRIQPNSQIYALRKTHVTPLLNDKNIVIKGDIQKKYSLKYIKNLDELNQKKIILDCAFICTPSSKHISDLIWLLKNDINCFIEKPLGSSLKRIDELESLVRRKKKIITMMGFQLRFNPIIQYLENIIKRGSPIGRIYSAHIHHGEHIADFHPYEDYKTSYAANKILGGGVILTQIHEIDYLLHLFAKYEIIKMNSISSKLSDLKVNVEDVFSSNFLLKNNKKLILCSMNLNFFERPKKRKIFLIGKYGTIEVCLNSQKIIIIKNNKKIEKKFNFAKNDIFIKELKFFLSKIKSNQKISKNMNLHNGIKTLRLALKLNNFLL
jgi:predicted dehydrogenase|tara:strand:+ start:2259 stop:3281 length:1023 start_codon:yes stop_codon:yes gene_type:complete